MGSLSLSDLPFGTLHIPAFDPLTFILKRADGDGTFVLTITRRCDGHVAVDKLHLAILRHESCVYIVSSCEAVQCCPNAPQEDLRYTLFNNGSWVVDGSRCLTSDGDLHCTGSPLGIQLPIDSRPAPQSKEVTLLLNKFFSGFAALLNETDSSSAIEVAWKGADKKPSLLSVWEDSARRGQDATFILARTTKTKKQEQAKANYLHWLSQLMLGCLVYVQTGGKIKHDEPRKTPHNCFITWSRRIPKILQLLSVAGAAALLILTSLGNSFFVFKDLERTREENMGNFTNTLWQILGPRLAAIERLLRGTTAYDRRVPMFNPTAFTRHYLTLQLQTPVTNEDICKQLGVEDWATVGSEVFEEKTIGEVLSSLRSFQSTNEEERQARQNNEETAHQWAAAWLQSNHIDLTPAHNQDQTLDIPNENTSYPANPSQGILMPNGWPTEQPLPLQATPVQDTLANAASQACLPHHGGDSGFGGEATHYQEYTASLQRVYSAGSQMTFPRNTDDGGTGLGGTSEHLVPDYDSAGQSAACIRETNAVVPNEGSLFLPSQSSIDSGYASNVGSQQVHGTTSVASQSGAFFSRRPLPSCRWTRAAAGQKRLQVGDNAASKRHRPRAEETTENPDTSEASNADPESPASTSHTVPQGGVVSGTLCDTADPLQHQTFEELLQGSGMSAEEWEAMVDGISATSGMACDSWDGMFEGIPATSAMAHGDFPINDELQDVDFSENAATLPTFLSEPHPNGTVPPAEETET